MAKLETNIRKQQAKNKILKQNGKRPIVFDLLDGTDITNDGSKTSICSICGKEFEQDLRKNGTYSGFKTCHGCRFKKNKGKNGEVAVYEEQLLYSPHKWQQKFHEIVASNQIRVVTLACGARTGKDYACIMESINQVNVLANECRPVTDPEKVPSYIIWYIGPNEKILNQNWAQIKKFMPKAFLPKGDRSIDNSNMRMELIQGGLLEVRSAYDPDLLVGVAVDFCVITEASRIRDLETVWRNIEARLMSPGCGIGGKGGKVVINSSPTGKNYFYKIFTWGKKSHPMYDSQFYSFQLTSDENPAVKAQNDELVEGFNGEKITKREQLRRRWGEKKFAQDYLGQFIDAGGTAFPNVDKCFFNPFLEMRDKTKEEIKEFIREWKAPKVGEIYRFGYDPATGSSQDTPALVVRENSTMNIVNQIDLYGLVDDAQWDKVAYWSKYYNNAEVCILTTGGYAVIEGQLNKRGVMTISVGEEGVKKRGYVMALQSAITNQDIHFLEDGSAEQETMKFQLEDYSENEKTGKFSNVSEEHDDFVSALYACYHDYMKVVEVKTCYSPRIGAVKRIR